MAFLPAAAGNGGFHIQEYPLEENKAPGRIFLQNRASIASRHNWQFEGLWDEAQLIHTAQDGTQYGLFKTEQEAVKKLALLSKVKGPSDLPKRTRSAKCHENNGHLYSALALQHSLQNGQDN